MNTRKLRTKGAYKLNHTTNPHHNTTKKPNQKLLNSIHNNNRTSHTINNNLKDRKLPRRYQLKITKIENSVINKIQEQTIKPKPPLE